MYRFTLFLLCAAACCAETNLDESKVRPYTLPDPLVMSTGERVRDAQTWVARRRPEILRLFEENVQGPTPTTRVPTTFEVMSEDRKALGGIAIRRQITMWFTPDHSGPRAHILLYVPADAKRPVPAFVGLNFNGNQSVSTDPGIDLNDVWVERERTMVRVRAEEKSRGVSAHQWQVEKILGRGYALATVYYGDLEPDFDGGMQYGIRPLLGSPEKWGAIGAWAWGLSRLLDYLERDKDIDAKRVAVMGHSRLGKTALWAGAQDTRFAIVISNDSGEGGAALARRNFGEEIADLNRVFPWWFSPAYKQYSGHADRLPVDAHELLALMAPRPVYVDSADQDVWADPRGEFLAAVAAGPVYELFGKRGLGTDRMPGVEQPIQHDIGYHLRAGKHDVTEYDWDRWLDFADMHFGYGRRATSSAAGR